jgi:hypothetical protein
VCWTSERLLIGRSRARQRALRCRCRDHARPVDSARSSGRTRCQSQVSERPLMDLRSFLCKFSARLGLMPPDCLQARSRRPRSLGVPGRLPAPSCSGRADTVVAVEGSLGGLRMIPTTRPARRRIVATHSGCRSGEWAADGAGLNSLPAGVVQCGLELSERAGELVALRPAAYDRPGWPLIGGRLRQRDDPGGSGPASLLCRQFAWRSPPRACSDPAEQGVPHKVVRERLPHSKPASRSRYTKICWPACGPTRPRPSRWRSSDKGGAARAV